MFLLENVKGYMIINVFFNQQSEQRFQKKWNMLGLSLLEQKPGNCILNQLEFMQHHIGQVTNRELQKSNFELTKAWMIISRSDCERHSWNTVTGWLHVLEFVCFLKDRNMKVSESLLTHYCCRKICSFVKVNETLKVT